MKILKVACLPVSSKILCVSKHQTAWLQVRLIIGCHFRNLTPWARLSWCVSFINTFCLQINAIFNLSKTVWHIFCCWWICQNCVWDKINDQLLITVSEGRYWLNPGLYLLHDLEKSVSWTWRIHVCCLCGPLLLPLLFSSKDSSCRQVWGKFLEETQCIWTSLWNTGRI